MATITSVKCDVCGVVKQDVNHWFVVLYDTNAMKCLIAAAGTLTADNIRMLASSDPTHCDFADCCGAAHVQQKVSEYLSAEKKRWRSREELQ
jgi:hypothetical protein